MKQVIFLATLMYSSAAVFGIPGEKSGLSDQLNNSCSKVRLVEVSVQKPSDKQTDRQTLEESLKKASRDQQQAKKDVECYEWLYKDALKRKESTDERIKVLTQVLLELDVSENSDQKSKKIVDVDKDISRGSSSDRTVSKSRRTTQNISKIDSRSPVLKLNELLQSNKTPYKLSDVVFFYDINKNGTFNCRVKLQHGESEEIRSFDRELSCTRKKEAKCEIAKYVYKVLKSEVTEGETSFSESDYEIDNENSVEKLYKLLQSNKIPYKLSDLKFSYDINKGGFNCRVKLQHGESKEIRSFDRELSCTSKKEAKYEIAKYVYKVLKSEVTEGETSSTESN